MESQYLKRHLSCFVLLTSFLTIVFSCKNTFEYKAIKYDYGMKQSLIVKDYPDSGYFTILSHPGDYGLNTVTITKLFREKNKIILRDVHRDKIDFTIYSKPDTSLSISFVNSDWNFVYVPYILRLPNDTISHDDFSQRKIMLDSARTGFIEPYFLCDTLIKIDSISTENLFVQFTTKINLKNDYYWRYYFKDYIIQNTDTFDLNSLKLKESVELFGFSAAGVDTLTISSDELKRYTKGFRKNID